MKIAVLGGSFNPVHIGHLILADSVCTELGYDRIIFVPSFIPPHKLPANDTDPSVRLKMLGLALEDDERFVLDSCEIDRKGVSYTYDTVCHLEQKYADSLDGKIGLIIGEDLAADFDKWHRASELAQKVQLILAVREEVTGVNPENINRPAGKFGQNPACRGLEDFPFPHVTVHNPPVKVSSSLIRQLAAEKKSFRYLVTEKVFEYILNGHLYES